MLERSAWRAGRQRARGWPWTGHALETGGALAVGHALSLALAVGLAAWRAAVVLIEVQLAAGRDLRSDVDDPAAGRRAGLTSCTLPAL